MQQPLQQQQIDPIENLILAGFQQRFKQVFNCDSVYKTSTDAIRSLEKTKGGQAVRYPMAFISRPNIRPAEPGEGYLSHTLSRRGLAISVGADNASVQMVRLMSVVYEHEIEFKTNKYQATEQGSVLSFTRRWMFARRNRYLNFKIEYGRLDLYIKVELDGNLSPEPRDNATDSETAYSVNGQVKIQGWISEPILGQAGLVQEVETQAAISGTSEFWTFPRKD